ncbi:hypothetical protein [Staphylococcus aureus]
MIRRPPRSTQGVSSAASDVYKRQFLAKGFLEGFFDADFFPLDWFCLLYTSPSPRDTERSRMPSSA